MVRKAITITDIAREVGVSPQVVSQVLHGGKSTAGARREIREKIRKHAAERGYRPFAASQILRKGSFRSVGVLIGDPNDFLLSQLALAGLTEGLAEKEYTATLFYAKARTDSDLLDSRLISSKLTDALVIPYVREPSRHLVNELKTLDIPVIWMNRHTRYDAVRMDESSAASLLLRHLASEGNKKVIFLDYSSGGKDAHTRERLKGLKKEAGKLGVRLDVHLESVARTDRALAARAFLRRHRCPGAMIINSLSAAQVFLQVAHQLQLKLPEDVALASFDDGSQYTANTPFVTCAIRPDFAFGRCTADMVLTRLENPSTFLPLRKLEFDLRIGGSTRRDAK